MNFRAKERQLVCDNFDTRDLLDAVDSLDALRQELGDSDLRPPEVRIQLLTLHTLLHEGINMGVRNVDAVEVSNLLEEIDMTLFHILEYVEQTREPLDKLRNLFNQLDEELFDDEEAP
jgi:glutathionyl-hydroquinone reductase